MKRSNSRREDTPSTVKQLAAAMIALGKYTGENSDAEHTAEAKRLGGREPYRILLANALLGIAEIDAMFADSAGVSADLNTSMNSVSTCASRQIIVSLLRSA